MYDSWTESEVLWRNILGIIWDLWDVFMVHICSVKAQIQSLNSYRSFLRDDFENRFLKTIQYRLEKTSKNSTVN